MFFLPIREITFTFLFKELTSQRAKHPNKKNLLKNFFYPYLNLGAVCSLFKVRNNLSLPQLSHDSLKVNKIVSVQHLLFRVRQSYFEGMYQLFLVIFHEETWSTGNYIFKNIKFQIYLLEIFIKPLLWAKYCARCWRYNEESNKYCVTIWQTTYSDHYFH